MERRANAGLAFNRNASAVVAYDRLHDRKAQPGAVLLRRVVRREKPLALFRRQSAAGVGNLEFHVAILVRRAQHQHSARRHRVHGVEHQIFNRAVQQRRVGLNHGQVFFQMKFGRDRRTSHGAELRLE